MVGSFKEVRDAEHEPFVFVEHVNQLELSILDDVRLVGEDLLDHLVDRVLAAFLVHPE